MNSFRHFQIAAVAFLGILNDARALDLDSSLGEWIGSSRSERVRLSEETGKAARQLRPAVEGRNFMDCIENFALASKAKNLRLQEIAAACALLVSEPIPGAAALNESGFSSTTRKQQTLMPMVGYGFPNGKPLDVVGIYPGMSYAQAFQIVRDYLGETPKISTKANNAGELEVDAITGPWVNGGRTDNLTVWLSPATADNQVIGVARHFSFTGPQPMDSLVLFSALKAKYGPPGRVWDVVMGRSFDTSYNQSTVPPSSHYSLRWVFNVFKNSDSLTRDVCLSNQMSRYVGPNISLESADFEFYSEKKQCGVVLDIEVWQSQDSVSSMDILMVDFERTSRAIGAAESPDDKQ